MTQITASHLQPHVLRRPPRRSPALAPVRASRVGRTAVALAGFERSGRLDRWSWLGHRL